VKMISNLFRSFSHSLRTISPVVSTCSKQMSTTQCSRLLGCNQRISSRCFANSSEQPAKVHMPDKDGILQPTPEIEAMADKFAQMSVVEQVMFGRALAKRIGIPFETLISGGGGGGGGGNAAISRPDPAAEAEAAKKAEEAKAAAEAAAKPAVKTEVLVRLTAVPADAKYKVLKEVRKLVPTMPLIDCKNLIEKLPADIKDAVPMAAAEEAKKLIEAAGGTVVLV